MWRGRYDHETWRGRLTTKCGRDVATARYGRDVTRHALGEQLGHVNRPTTISPARLLYTAHVPVPCGNISAVLPRATLVSVRHCSPSQCPVPSAASAASEAGSSSVALVPHTPARGTGLIQPHPGSPPTTQHCPQSRTAESTHRSGGDGATVSSVHLSEVCVAPLLLASEPSHQRDPPASEWTGQRECELRAVRFGAVRGVDPLPARWHRTATNRCHIA
jgi:hypothetical protein